jgi:hypothetical protein
MIERTTALLNKWKKFADSSQQRTTAATMVWCFDGSIQSRCLLIVCVLSW